MILSMQGDNKKIGALGEEIAKLYLIQKGYTILETNFRCKIGEIDIIAKKNKVIIFCEIKANFTSSSSAFRPEVRVNPHKAAKLRRLAEIYIKMQNLSTDQGFQIDVLGVEIQKESKTARVSHTENAIFDV